MADSTCTRPGSLLLLQATTAALSTSSQDRTTDWLRSLNSMQSSCFRTERVPNNDEKSEVDTWCSNSAIPAGRGRLQHHAFTWNSATLHRRGCVGRIALEGYGLSLTPHTTSRSGPAPIVETITLTRHLIIRTFSSTGTSAQVPILDGLLSLRMTVICVDEKTISLSNAGEVRSMRSVSVESPTPGRGHDGRNLMPYSPEPIARCPTARGCSSR